MTIGVLDESVLEAFRSTFRGELIAPGGSAYEQARRVWNGMIDRRPALIVRCAGVADVIDAVDLAREQGLRVAVRGGGHGVAGNAVADDALVIDLSPMKGIRVGRAAGTVRAEAGCTLGDVDRETQAFGLAAPLGVVSKTGIAGLTLAGGIGWLRRSHGLTVDNLVSADVVTADGRFLTASEDENADLLWGLRGGGGNFGVVTSFEYRLHPLGPEVMLLFVLYPGDRAGDVLLACDQYMATAPDEVAPVAILGFVPPMEMIPAERHGEFFAGVAGIYAGDPGEGEEILRPLRELGDPVADLSGRMPYRTVQQLLDEDYPDGRSYYWKSVDLEELTGEVVDRVVEHGAAAPSAYSTMDVWYHGGAMGRVEAGETAFGPRPPYLIGVEANFAEGADENLAWARRAVDDLRRFSGGGAYLNFAGFFEEGEALLRASYGDENYERLVALKNVYDPTNLFRLNGNIQPTV